MIAPGSGASPLCGATRSQVCRTPSIALHVVVLLLLLPAIHSDGHAQLVSPGPLSEPHASVDGLSNCIKCHRLGRKGVEDDRCLSCHTTLDVRIRVGSGYHAALAGQACAECHKDHFGRDFAIVSIDTATFDHTLTGYLLEGAHRDAACGGCHSADHVRAADVLAWGQEHGALNRTSLGLDDSCQSCHTVDDPHGGQFPGQQCEACHATIAWDRTERFDHDRTAYRLTGEHRQASCDGCHPEEWIGGRAVVRYAGAASGDCDTCHEDEHLGTMGADCTSCHDARSWSLVDRAIVASSYDHSATAYPLRGKHAEASCDACHLRPRRIGDAVQIQLVAGTERAAYPVPHAGFCASCHIDAHSAELAGRPDGGSCESCHDEYAWSPASFGVERHNEETGYALTGAHLVVYCSGCHEDDAAAGEGVGLRFTVEDQACVSCHLSDDPHERNFGNEPCETCHGTGSFAEATFDHTMVGSLTCNSCHEPDDPHAGQFGDDGCDRCHGTASYLIPDYDHTDARFQLEGGHRTVSCAECHPTEADAKGTGVVRYRPLPVECAACHGSPS